MPSDLPDYEKRIIIVTPPGEYPAMLQVDLRKILGENLITPTIAGCVPTSIENDAIAYDAVNDWFKTYIENPALAYDDVNDRFKVDIEAISAGVIGTETDLAKVLGAALSHANPVIMRLTNGSAFIDPRDRNWALSGGTDEVKIREAIVTFDDGQPNTNQRTFKNTDGTFQILLTYPYYYDPTSGTWYRTRDPRSIRALTSADIVSAVQSDETLLKATVTQAAKDRTISDVTKTATPVSITASSGGNNTIHTPASGKKIRVKLIDVWNNGAADITVYLRFAAAGTARFKKTLAAKTGFIVNLIGSNWEGAADEALIINLSAAGTVDVTVMKDEV